ncbi:MAG: hypothetical protein J6Q83_00015 [Clostridia bacterium]|nr:hypothetical protein [Clostridia bacterium]
MGLFSKKEMDVNAAKSFWNWFCNNEEWIKNNVESNGMDVIWAIDEQIKPVFPYFKKELEFQLGYNDGVGEFFFFHFNDKTLKRDAEAFKSMLPEKLAEVWTVILDA